MMKSARPGQGRKPVLPSVKKLLALLSARLNRPFEQALVWAEGHQRPLKAGEEFGSTQWTNALLNSILDEGTERGFEVWPVQKYLAFDSSGAARNRNYERKEGSTDRGEWMLDACWTSYPPLGAWVDDLLTKGKDTGGGIALACESEWGSRAGGKVHLRMVLDDFAKLVAVQAPLKVMFFGFFEEKSNSSFKSIESLCRIVAAKDQSSCTYLLMGWPFFAPWAARMDFEKSIFTPAQARRYSLGR